jgi:hypothetical protein
MPGPSLAPKIMQQTVNNRLWEGCWLHMGYIMYLHRFRYPQLFTRQSYVPTVGSNTETQQQSTMTLRGDTHALSTQANTPRAGLSMQTRPFLV